MDFFSWLLGKEEPKAEPKKAFIDTLTIEEVDKSAEDEVVLPNVSEEDEQKMLEETEVTALYSNEDIEEIK